MTTKEFEKQTLDQLLIDLKDIDNYKSFRKGAFVYDLGYYQGQLLLNEINRLNNIIDELEKYIKENVERCRITFNETQDIKWLDYIEIYGCIEYKLKGDNK